MALAVAELKLSNKPPGAAWALAAVEVRSLAPQPGRAWQVTEVLASSPTPIPVLAGVDQNLLLPGRTVTLAGSGAVVGTWRQTAGPYLRIEGGLIASQDYGLHEPADR
jgi:hypothetical protein